MGIDRTQSAIEILKYFNDNSDRDYGITVSELRKRILPRKNSYDVWLKSKLGLWLVKDLVSTFIEMGFVENHVPIAVKDNTFQSFRITPKGRVLVTELRKAKNLRDLFSTILYKEVIDIK
jgi:hypothetical protein